MVSITDLPEVVLCKIMEGLNMKDFARFMFSSKIVREASKRLLQLRVNSRDIYVDYNRRSRRLFCNFFSAYMRDRDGNYLQLFTLHWNFFGKIIGEQVHIAGWIQEAVNCNIQHLILDFGHEAKYGRYFRLPRCVYHHRSLTTFAFRRGIMGPLPDTGFDGLEGLMLEDVYVNHQRFGEWISSSSKKLEKLGLCMVGGLNDFNVESLSLQDLTMITAEDHVHSSILAPNLQCLNLFLSPSSINGSLMVYAPSLQYITLDGCVAEQCSLSNFNNLKAAQICIEYDGPYAGQNLVSVDRFLRSFEQTNHLSLTAKFLEFLLVRNCQSEILQKVQKLDLHLHRKSDCQLPKIASLLRRLSNLRILKIRYCREYVKWAQSVNFRLPKCSKNLVLGELQNFKPSLQLEEVEIELRSGFIGLELVEHFFRHARSLKKMSVRYVQGEFHEIDIQARMGVLKSTWPAGVVCSVGPILQKTVACHRFPYLYSRFLFG